MLLPLETYPIHSAQQYRDRRSNPRERPRSHITLHNLEVVTVACKDDKGVGDVRRPRTDEVEHGSPVSALRASKLLERLMNPSPIEFVGKPSNNVKATVGASIPWNHCFVSGLRRVSGLLVRQTAPFAS